MLLFGAVVASNAAVALVGYIVGRDAGGWTVSTDVAGDTGEIIEQKLLRLKRGRGGKPLDFA
jgi:hypothetical protein